MKCFQRRFCLLMIAITISLVSCEKSCQKKAEIPPPAPKKADETQPKAENLITNFPDLKLQGLTKSQVTSATKLFNEEVSPCGCPSTFAQSINEPGCKPGVLLAQWTINQLKDGAPEHYLYKAVMEEINNGYTAPPKLSRRWMLILKAIQMPRS